MRALFCDGSTVRLRRDLPAVKALDGEVVLRVRSVGICDTDMQLARGYMGYRGVLGHEFVGVDDRGRRFVAEINNACQRCETCLAGRPTHCPTRTVLGIVGHDGAMADEVAVPTENLHAVPDAVGDHAAVFVEPLAAAFQILEQVRVLPTDRVAVLGDGKLGLLSAWVLRTASERVTLVGRHAHKLALAGERITQRTVDRIEDVTRSFDVVVDATGSPSGLPTAFKLARPRGTIVLKTTVAAGYTLALSPVVIDEFTIVGSRCGPFSRAIAALERGVIDVGPLVSEVFPLDEAEAAFACAGRRGVAKVVIDVSPDGAGR